MMNKQRISLFAALLLSLSFCLSVAVSACAAAPLVRDEIGLFDADTLASLEQQAEDASAADGSCHII